LSASAKSAETRVRRAEGSSFLACNSAPATPRRQRSSLDRRTFGLLLLWTEILESDDYGPGLRGYWFIPPQATTTSDRRPTSFGSNSRFQLSPSIRHEIDFIPDEWPWQHDRKGNEEDSWQVLRVSKMPENATLKIAPGRARQAGERRSQSALMRPLSRESLRA